MTNSSLPLEAALLSQATSLRALAWSLVGDEHAADDVLQDAWLRASENRTRHEADSGSLNGWLRRIAANLARNKRRAERSRAYHEESASRTGAHAAVDELAMERELMRQVIDAISELDEPYQSVIIMRYYQELAPRLIAKERGVPVATIKSQLHRALEMLRTRLDGLNGGWRHQWAGIMALSLARGSSAKFGATVVAGTVVLAASLLTAIGVWQFGGIRNPTNETPLASVSTNELSHSNEVRSEAAPQNHVSLAADEKPARVSVDPEIAWATAAIALPYQFSLRIEVVDAEDWPVRSTRVLLAPEGHPINLVGRVDEAGVLEINWRGGEPQMTMVLGLSGGNGLESGMRKVELRAGSSLTVRVPVGHRALHDEVLRSLLGVGYTMQEDAVSPRDMPSWRRLEAPRHPPHAILDEKTGETTFRWVGGSDAPASRPTSPESVLSALSALGYVENPVQRSIDSPSGSAIEVDERTVTEVTGRVMCASGEPAAGARFGGYSFPGGIESVTFDNGGFELGLILESTLELRAGGGVFGFASQNFEFAPGEVPKRIDWNPVLDRGNEISGTIESALEWDVELELEHDGGLFVDLSGVSRGGFSLLNLPRGRGRLILSDGYSWPLASLIREVWPEREFSTKIDLDEYAIENGAVEVLVVDATGIPQSAEVQLWQLSSGRGVWLEFDEATGRHRRSTVPTGEYRITVSHGPSSYVDAGVIEVVDGGSVTVGPVQIEQSAQLSFRAVGEVSGADRGTTWTLLRLGLGVHSVYLSKMAQSGAEIHMPAGSYRVVMTSNNGALPPINFEVSAGATHSIDISLDEMGECVLRALNDESREFRILSADGADEVHVGSLVGLEGARFLLPVGDYVLDCQGIAQPFSIRAGEQTVL